MENKTLSQLDLDTIWHPFTQMKTLKPIVIESGKGSYLFSETGQSYLDAISSWWVNLHGHSHPDIIKKITTQAEKLEHVIFADFTHSAAIELATELIPLLPGNFSKIFFSDNGSTAVETALKMALQYWFNKNPTKNKRKKVLCFKKGYHGDTFGAMSASGKNVFNRPFWSYLFDVIMIAPPLEDSETVFEELNHLLSQDDIACFIFEPLVLGAAGMITYSRNGLNTILKMCRAHDIILIADEVMTGFGRTGTLFACDQLQEKPDIICLSKGITGGFLPLGATACCEKIYGEFLSDSLSKAFLHGHSYSGNPLACSSAVASLKLLLKDECNIKRKMIERSHQDFCHMWSHHPRFKRCETLGTLLILEYTVENPSYFSAFRDTLYLYFLKNGVLVRPLGNVLYIMPPYCITPDELLTIYNLIIQTLKESFYE